MQEDHFQMTSTSCIVFICYYVSIFKFQWSLLINKNEVDHLILQFLWMQKSLQLKKLIQHNQTKIASTLLNSCIKKCLLQLLMQTNSKDMIPNSCWTRTWFIMTLVFHTLTLLIVIHWRQWKIVLWKSFNILFHHKYSIILFSCFFHRYTILTPSPFFPTLLLILAES